MVEDEVADAKLVEHVLCDAGYKVELKRVETEEEFIRILDSNAPDIILSDHGLPSFDGFAALKLAKQKAPQIPFIFVTRVFDEATLVRSLREGATDYVLKNGLSKLAPALISALKNGLQSASAKSSDTVSLSALQSFIDDLTVENICVINQAGQIVLWSKGAERQEKLSSKQAIGKDFSILFSKEEVDTGKPKEIIERVRKLGKYEDSQKTNEASTVVYKTLMGASGEVEGVIRYVKKSVPSVKDGLKDPTELTFKKLVEATTDYGICMLDPKGNVVTWNTGIARLTGYQEEEILGKNMALFFTQEDILRGVPETELEKCRAAGGSTSEGYCRRKNGTTFYTEWTLTSIFDDHKKLAGFSRIFRDISYRKAREDAIRLENQKLEVKVSERTQQLQETIKELEAFSYSVSHDLRAPLRHISGFVNILQETSAEALDEAARGYLKIIADSVKQMDLLIDNLLSFSRVGRAEMHKINFNFDQVLQVAIREFDFDMVNRKVDWVIGNVGDVHGDPHLIRQVITNLLSNALKYTRTKPVARIEISSETLEQEKVVHIKDNGVGFDMKYSNKLFGVFQRLHPESDFEGTGIGLANVRRIIQRHGGRVWASGKVGEGAEFSFSLPKPG